MKKAIVIGLFISLFLLGCVEQECPPCKIPTVNCPNCTEQDEAVYIHFIDVGQGDATLIKYKDTEILIDCGKSSIGYKVVDYLEDLDVEELEYLLITHPDEDHMGGCYDVLRDINTKRIITNGQERTNVFFEDVIDLIDTEQLTTTYEGETISLGPATIKTIQADTDSEDFNQNSIVTKLVLKETSVLFTGDCDKECEDLLLTKDIESNILKVPHHGSMYGTSISFLEKVKPEVAVILVGKNNNYGHPTNSVLDRLSQEGVLVYRTDLNGNIIVTVTDEGYSIN